MNLKIAIQMDPIERLKFETDSTIPLAEEAQRRGHSVSYYTPDTMALHGTTLTALVKPLEIDCSASPPWRTGTPERADLRGFDLILMRQDPPFDMAYITATHLLEHVMKDVLVLNDPVSVRNAPEKLLVTHFPDLMPPTVITGDANVIRAFYQEHGDIVLKPLYGNAGLHVLHIGPESDNLNGAIKIFQDIYREPIIAQKYLSAIRQGDKRIMLIDGKPVGGLNRIPQEHEARATLALGARPEKLILSKQDRNICDRLGPVLSKMNLIFAGVDVIGGFVTEINVTSPTGIPTANRLDNINIQSMLWDCFEEKINALKRTKV